MKLFQVLIPFIGFFAPVLSFAQTDFLYHEITEVRSNEVIKGVVKDSSGFIWLATDQGVLRYDGTSTDFFFRGLRSPFTKKFLNTQSGDLLVLTDFGVQQVIEKDDSVAFVTYTLNGHLFDQQLTYPKSIYQDQGGNIWIGEINSIVRINSDGFKRFDLGTDYQSISYHRTFSFGEDAFGHIWAAPFKGKLLTFDTESDEFQAVGLELPISEVTDLLVVKGDYLIISGKEGLLKLKVDSDKRILERAVIDGLKNISDLAGNEHNIFVGTWDNGLFDFDLSSGRIQKIGIITFNDIIDIYHDKESQEFWIGGSENVGLLSASVVASLGEVGKYRIESLTVENGDLFYSTGQEILQFDFQHPFKTPRKVIQSQNNYFDCVEIDGSDLWIGDSFGAIFKYDLTENSLTKVKDSTTGKAMKFIFQDSKRRLWFTGDENYLIQVNDADDLILHPEVSSSNVIKESPEGILYVGGFGSNNLLYKYDSLDQIFHSIPLQLDFTYTNISVEDITFNENGDLWLATNFGIIFITRDGFQAKQVQIPGLEINEPFKSVEYFNGTLWLGGTQGLTAYNGEESVLFTNKNGLPSRILKERGIRIYKDQLLIATAKGLARINPKIEIFRKTPSPHFKNIVVNGKYAVAIGEEKQVLPYNARIQAEFLTLTYPGGNVLYQSRILGIDSTWSDPTSNRYVSFLGYSEGDYSLQVRAKDLGYLWSDPITFRFTIGQPWYKTWWAYFLFAIVSVIVISIAIRVYNYSLIVQRRKLKRIIELRTEQINSQKNEIIEQKNRIIQQKEELIEKNNAVYRSQQALSEADLNFLHLKEKQLRDQLEYRNKQITTHTLNIIQKNETLNELREKLEGIIKSPDKGSTAELRKTLRIIDESFKLDKDWEEFRLYFEQIYTGFYTKLKINCPALTTLELRHCALIRLNLSLAECASLLGISPDSVKVSRARIRKKLDLEAGQGLTDFILSV